MTQLRDSFLFLPSLDADSGGGGGAGSASDDANPGGQQGAEGSQGATQPTTQAAQSAEGTTQQPFAIFPDEKSFTARVGREAKSQLSSLAKELGFDSVEAMQEAAKATRERADAEKTELEKAQAALSKAENDRLTALDVSNARTIRAEAKVQAIALGIKPERVSHALKLADLSEATVDAAGEADVAAIRMALEAVLADVPELKAMAPVTVGAGSNPPGGDNTGKTDISKLTSEEFAALQKRALAGERIQL